MTKGRRIVIELGPYEIEMGKQMEGKDGDIYHVFTHSDNGLHASIHPSGRIHLRSQRDSKTGERSTDIRFRSEHKSKSNPFQLAEDLLRNAFFVPTEYPNAFAVDVPNDFASLVVDKPNGDMRVNMFDSLQQFADSFSPLTTEAEILRELTRNINSNRVVVFMHPDAGFCMLCPPTTPDERPYAFSPKWFTEKTLVGKELLGPSNEAIDTGMSMTQDVLTDFIASTVDPKILKEQLQRLLSDAQFEKVVERMPEQATKHE